MPDVLRDNTTEGKLASMPLSPSYFLRRVISLAALVALPLLGLHVYTLYSTYRTAQSGSFKAATTESAEKAKDVEEALFRAESLLNFLAQRQDVIGLDRGSCTRVVANAADMDPLWAAVGVGDLKGNRICSSLSKPNEELGTFPDQGWYATALAAEGFTLSRVIPNRLLRKPMASLALPLRDAKGVKVGLVVVALDMVALADMLADSGMPAGSSVALIRDDDSILTRYPGAETWAGAMVPAAADRRTVKGSSDVARLHGVDNVDRLYARADLSRYNLRVVAGVPAGMALTQLKADIGNSPLIAALLACAALALAYYCAGRLARGYESVVRVLRGGDGDAPPLALSGDGAMAFAPDRFEGNQEHRALMAEAMEMGRRYRQTEELMRALQASTERRLLFYSALCATGPAIARTTSPQALYEAVCRICVETGQAPLVWVGLLGERTVTPVASCKRDATGGPMVPPTLSIDRESRAMRELMAASSILARHPVEDPYGDNALDTSNRFAVGNFGDGCLILPFRTKGQVSGFLNIYLDDAGFFDSALVTALEATAAEVSRALDNFTVRAAHADAEVTLGRKESQLSTIVKHAKDAIVTANASYDIVVFNDAAVGMFGLSRADAIGSPLLSLLPEQHRSTYHAKLLRDTLRPDLKDEQVFELTGRHASGREFPLQVTVSYTGAESSRLTTLIGRDMEAIREAAGAREAASVAQAANVAKTRFLSQMSHEVRTPLNAVLGFTQLLKASARDKLTPRELEHLDVVFQAGAQLRALVDDVLDVSRIEQGKLSTTLVAVDLTHLLEGCFRLTAVDAAAHEITLVPDFRTGEPLCVHTDPSRLRQVVLNLLSNAVKYNRKGGSVTLAAQSHEDGIEVIVSDNGMGMSAGQLAELYQPFNRLGRETGPVEGTGLGLSLSRDLMVLLKGRLDIDSTAGLGTTARIWVPADKGGLAAPLLKLVGGPELPVTLTSDAPHGVLLYIEDSEVNVLLVQQLLSRWPAIDFHSAGSGREGIALAKQIVPTLILLDMELPDMEGLEILARIKAEAVLRDTEVVVVSGHAMEDYVVAVKAAGASDYWTKPLDFPQFLQGIETLMPGRRRGS